MDTVSVKALTILAFEELKLFFRTETEGHAPSPLMLAGLYNLQDTLSRMVVGDLSPMQYVSSLDPGVGKTSAIKAWLKVYLPKIESYGDKGVILCFDRLDEIQNFLKDSPLAPSGFGVYVSEDREDGRELNRMGVGHQNIWQAPVLFTTKQQIINKGQKLKSFAGIQLFHYRGLPRAIRIWDESAIVGRPLSTTRGYIQELCGVLEAEGSPLYEVVDSLNDTLKTCTTKAVITFPDLGGMDFFHGFRWEGDRARRTAETLAMLSGRPVTVRIEGSGRAVLDCIGSIPDDFYPYLVTDASARIRENYNLLDHYHQRVAYLEPRHSVKRYDPLTISVWDRSSSRDYYSKQGVEMTSAEVAKVVRSIPEEAFLIVTMKGKNGSVHERWKKAIKAHLPSEDHSRLHFLTWGRHTAVNDYGHIPNVILTSQLHYSPSGYEVAGMASANLPSSMGSLTNEQLKDFRNGEVSHHLLQCICRGAVRAARGDSCPPSGCWIIADKSTGIRNLLPGIFPGCDIRPWSTSGGEEGTTNEAHQKAIQFIHKELEASGGDPVSITRLRSYMGYGATEKSNFRKRFLENTDFINLCTAEGIILDKGANGRWTVEKNPFRDAA